MEHQNESKISRVSTRLLIFIVLSLVVFKKLSKGRQGMAATKKPTVGAQFKVSYTIFLRFSFCFTLSYEVVSQLKPLGSFSIDHGDGDKNVTFKLDSRFLNFVAFLPMR